MADAFRIQQEDSKMKNVTFEDRFAMLVDIEYNRRKDNRLKRLIKEADFEQPDACIAGIDYTSGRKLNKELIARLPKQPILSLNYCTRVHFKAAWVRLFWGPLGAPLAKNSNAKDS